MLVADATDVPLDILTAVLAVATLVVAATAIGTLRSSARVLDQATAQTNAAEKMAEAETKALAAAIRPIVTSLPQDQITDVDSVEEGNFRSRFDKHVVIEKREKGSEKAIRVTVPIRNIGNGPAFLDTATLRVGKGTTDLMMPVDVLQSGDSTCLWNVEYGGSEKYSVLAEAASKGFYVEIVYRDAVRRQESRTRIRVGSFANERYFAPRRCEIECGEAEDFRVLKG